METVRTELLLGNRKVIVGSKYNDLVLETLGKIYIKSGNNFQLLTGLVESIGNSNPKDTIIVSNTSEMETMPYPGNGVFVFSSLNNTLYISYDNRYIKLIESTPEDKLSYVKTSGDTMTGLLEINTEKAPLIVASSELVSNLNAEYLNGYNDKLFAKKNVNENIAGLWNFQSRCTSNDVWTFNLNVDFKKDLIIRGSLGSPAFASGFGGYGWRFDANTNTLTVDYLVVRKAMNVYELVVNLISATNGSLWVSNAATVTNVLYPLIMPVSLLNYFQPDGTSWTGTDDLKNKFKAIFFSNVYYLITPDDISGTSLSINADTQDSDGKQRGIVTETKGLSSSLSLNTTPITYVNYKYLIKFKDIDGLLDSSDFHGIETLTDENLLRNLSNFITFKYISKKVNQSGSYVETFDKDCGFYALVNSEKVKIKSYYKYFGLRRDLMLSMIESCNNYFNDTHSKSYNFTVPGLYFIETKDYVYFKPGDIIRCLKFQDNNIKYYDAVVLSLSDDKEVIIQKAESVFDLYTEVEYSNGELIKYTVNYNNEAYKKTEKGYDPNTDSEYNQDENITTDEELILNRLADPSIEDDLVLMGNIFDPKRQNAIYITSTDDLSPFVDVLGDVNRPDYSVIYLVPVFRRHPYVNEDPNNNNGYIGLRYNYYLLSNSTAHSLIPNVVPITIDDQLYYGTTTPMDDSLIELSSTGDRYDYVTTTKVRLGKLDGIVDPKLGESLPYGYGLYGENVFLTGEFYLNNGKSVIEVSKEEIKLAVSGFLELIDNIKIGGRNYAKGTINEVKVTSITNGSNQTKQLGYKVTGLKKDDIITVSLDYEAYNINFASNSFIGIQFGSAYSYNQITSSLIKSNGSAHIKRTLTLNTHYNSSDPVVEEDDGAPFIRFDYITFNEGGYFLVKNFMVAKGSAETDWAPAPEDFEESIEDAYKAALNAQNSINLLNDDKVFSIVEKKVIRTEWENINGSNNVSDSTYNNGSYQQIIKLANNYNISHSLIDTAYTNLKSKLVDNYKLYVDENTSGFERTELSNLFTNYYNEEISLTKLVLDTYTDLSSNTRNYLLNTVFIDSDFTDDDGNLYLFDDSGVEISIDSTNRYNGNLSLKVTLISSASEDLLHSSVVWHTIKEKLLSPISLSMYVKVSNTSSATLLIGFESGVVKSFNVYPSWNRITIDNYEGESNILKFGVTNSNTIFYINSPMLTNTSRSLEWSPAPEDLGTKAEIKILSDEIKLKVDSTKFDLLTGKVTLQGTLIEQHSDAINLLAKKTDGLTEQVANIKVASDNISLKVNQLWPQNLFTDGSFENGGLSQIINVGGASTGLYTSQHKFGKYSLRISAPSGFSASYIGAIPIESNTEYTLVMWVKSITPFVENIGVTGFFWSKTKNIVEGQYSFTWINDISFTTSWTKVVAKAKAPSGYNYLMIRIGHSETSSTRYIYADGIMIFKGDFTSNSPDVYIENSNDGLLATGIDIANKKITVTSDTFEVKNNKGLVTTSINSNGYLSATGGDFSNVTVSGALTVEPLKIKTETDFSEFIQYKKLYETEYEVPYVYFQRNSEIFIKYWDTYYNTKIDIDGSAVGRREVYYIDMGNAYYGTKHDEGLPESFPEGVEVGIYNCTSYYINVNRVNILCSLTSASLVVSTPYTLQTSFPLPPGMYIKMKYLGNESGLDNFLQWVITNLNVTKELYEDVYLNAYNKWKDYHGYP